MNRGDILPDASILWADYEVMKSVHRVGEKHGTTGETVRVRLSNAGYRLNSSQWKLEEIAALQIYYAQTPANDFSRDAIAASLKRTKASVALKASRLGFSMPRGMRSWSDAQRVSASAAQKLRFESDPELRMALAKRMRGKPNPFLGKHHTDELKKNASETFKKSHRENGHPRGMLGKQHGQETKDAISKFHTGKKLPIEQVQKMMKTKLQRYGTLAPNRPHGSWKSSWIEVGGKRLFARSSWEANYAYYLEFQKTNGLIKDWEHEPKTFWFEGIRRGVCSYLPDFCVITNSGSEEYHEVKGWMDDRSKTKIKRMAKYHPAVTLVVIDSVRYRKLAATVKHIVKGWTTVDRNKITGLTPWKPKPSKRTKNK